MKILAPESDDFRGTSVHAGTGWKALLQAKTRPFGSPIANKSRPTSQGLINQEYDPTPVLAAQRDDIIALWRDPDVRKIMAKRMPRLVPSAE